MLELPPMPLASGEGLGRPDRINPSYAGSAEERQWHPEFPGISSLSGGGTGAGDADANGGRKKGAAAPAMNAPVTPEAQQRRFEAALQTIYEGSLPPDPDAPSDEAVRLRPSELAAIAAARLLSPPPEWGLTIDLSETYIGPHRCVTIARATILSRFIVRLDLSYCDLQPEACIELCHLLKQHFQCRSSVMKKTLQLDEAGLKCKNSGARQVQEERVFKTTPQSKGVLKHINLSGNSLGCEWVDTMRAGDTGLPLVLTAVLGQSRRSHTSSPADTILLSPTALSTARESGESVSLVGSREKRSVHPRTSETPNSQQLPQSQVSLRAPAPAREEGDAELPILRYGTAPGAHGGVVTTTDDVVDALASLVPYVESLQVAWNGLGDYCAVAMSSAMRQSSSIRFLDLRGNNVSTFGAINLLEAMYPMELPAPPQSKPRKSKGVPPTAGKVSRAASATPAARKSTASKSIGCVAEGGTEKSQRRSPLERVSDDTRSLYHLQQQREQARRRGVMALKAMLQNSHSVSSSRSAASIARTAAGRPSMQEEVIAVKHQKQQGPVMHAARNSAADLRGSPTCAAVGAEGDESPSSIIRAEKSLRRTASTQTAGADGPLESITSDSLPSSVQPVISGERDDDDVSFVKRGPSHVPRPSAAGLVEGALASRSLSSCFPCAADPSGADGLSNVQINQTLDSLWLGKDGNIPEEVLFMIQEVLAMRFPRPPPEVEALVEKQKRAQAKLTQGGTAAAKGSSKRK